MPTWRLLTRVDATAPPASRIDELLPSQAAGRARLAVVRGLPGVTGASLHLCPHAAGERPEEWYDCRADARAAYEEV
mgnify:CR=1 FL=1